MHPSQVILLSLLKPEWIIIIRSCRMNEYSYSCRWYCIFAAALTLNTATHYTIVSEWDERNKIYIYIYIYKEMISVHQLCSLLWILVNLLQIQNRNRPRPLSFEMHGGNWPWPMRGWVCVLASACWFQHCLGQRSFIVHVHYHYLIYSVCNARL